MVKTDEKNTYLISCPKCFDLGLCLDCGQAFRWENTPDGWHGVVAGRELVLSQQGSRLAVRVADGKNPAELIGSYFDFDTDYDKIIKSFDDKSLIQATREYYGIRILRQQPWEALCSFIISQNNNIPRIKGIINRLCENFGEKIGENAYSFPSAETLSTKTVEELAPLRSGFRAKYIIDAAQKVASGEVDLEKIREMPIEQARLELMKIKGVGAKVAECTLLYGFYRLEAFPVDVWVKRIVAELYPDGLPECFGSNAGIAQQYLFHWRRHIDKNG
jgi:N-glycosylase/DNA lyase